MDKFKVKSGVKIYTIEAASIDEARMKLNQIETKGWLDTSWAWSVESIRTGLMTDETIYLAEVQNV